MSQLIICDKCKKTHVTSSKAVPAGWVTFYGQMSGSLNDGKPYNVYGNFSMHICSECLGTLTPHIVEDLRQKTYNLEDAFLNLLIDPIEEAVQRSQDL